LLEGPKAGPAAAAVGVTAAAAAAAAAAPAAVYAEGEGCEKSLRLVFT
jgi:hypothetical protein